MAPGTMSLTVGESVGARERLCFLKTHNFIIYTAVETPSPLSFVPPILSTKQNALYLVAVQ